MYYVYEYIDPRNNKPFYVGKGTGNRVYKHLNETKDNYINIKKFEYIQDLKLNNLTPIINFVHNNIVEEEIAYELELNLILKYGRIGFEENGVLTNVHLERKPPSQKGVKRSELTKDKIKRNSLKDGKQRTIAYIKKHDYLIYNIICDIQNKLRRKIIVKKHNITIDLYNKIKLKLTKYIYLLNTHTKYNLVNKKITKINGMRQKLFSDNKELLIDMYNMIDDGIKRRVICLELNITLEFYDRNKRNIIKDEFIKFIGE